MWNRFKINSSYIFKTAGKWTMAIYAVLGLLATFVSLEGVLDAFCIVSLTDKIIVSVIILLIAYILCSVIVSLVILNKGIVKVLDAQNGHSVYVLYGNLFDENLLPSSVNRRSICFAVNRCFDTIVDNVIISASTIHGAIVNACAKVGRHCIINTGSTVGHDVVLGDFVHVAPHATVTGAVTVGEGTWIGAGAVVRQGIHIGKWCMIGAGAVVVKDVPDGVTVVGNPARVIKL